MTLQHISMEELVTRSCYLWDIQSLLLTSGDFSLRDFNAMTIGWGSLGYMWRRPFIQVVVRPVRYTYAFIERYDTFTVTAFPKEFDSALSLLGTKSGRDGDKITDSGLTPIPSTSVAAPGYKEAELILECRKMYWDDLAPEHFLNKDIDAHYPLKDYHRIYYGEILAIFGTEKYLS